MGPTHAASGKYGGWLKPHSERIAILKQFATCRGSVPVRTYGSMQVVMAGIEIDEAINGNKAVFLHFLA